MSDKSKKRVIRIDCPLDDYPGSYVLFKRAGWKFRHLREYESRNASASDIAALIASRVDDWFLMDDEGQEIPFEPGKTPEAVMDDLPPLLAAWLVGAFREAYVQAGLPDPN